MHTTKTSNDIEVIQEAEEVLLKHLGLAKATRFWMSLNKGAGDYISVKRNLFAGDTVDSLYAEIVKHQRKNKR